MPLPTPLAARVALAATLLVPSLTAQTPDGAELFVAQCARCHGVTGDGQGAEVLDRPARNFKDGGFSFGNTELAISRTIANGVPGSPMPAFGEALSDAEMTAIARHVMTLAPAQLEVAEAETILHVTDHPVVVRGVLPPIVEGALQRPRGLLLGLPGGLTFEYDGATGQLLGVRAGEFVRRTDWTGRGGQALQPLGKVVWLNEGGTWGLAGGLRFRHRDGEQLVAKQAANMRLLGTATSDRPSLTWQLEVDGSPVGRVEERPRSIRTPSASGFVRLLTFQMRSGAPAELERLLIDGTGDVGSFDESDGGAHCVVSADGKRATAWRRTDHVAIGPWSDVTRSDGDVAGSILLRFVGPEAMRPGEIEIATLLTAQDEPLTPSGILDELVW